MYFSTRDTTNVRISEICRIRPKTFLEEAFLHLQEKSKRRQCKKVWCKQGKNGKLQIFKKKLSIVFACLAYIVYNQYDYLSSIIIISKTLNLVLPNMITKWDFH